MPRSTDETKIFSQAETDAIMEKHRKGLQQTIKDQALRIAYLEDQNKLLSKAEYNPIAQLLLAEIRNMKGVQA